MKLILDISFIWISFISLVSLDENIPFFRHDYIYLKHFDAFYKYHPERNNFTGAVALCASESSQLFYPRSAEETNAVFDMISLPDLFRIWIGVHDLYSEGSFVTIDGIPIDRTYSKWYPREPNNFGLGEDCCVIFQNGGYFNDGTCYTLESYVCRRDAKSLPAYNTACEIYDNEYLYNIDLDKCYKLHKTPTTWRKANAICRAEQSKMVIINSEIEARVLVEELAKNPEHTLQGIFQKSFAFVGFSDLLINGNFVNIDGTSLAAAGYEKWSLGQPDNWMNMEHCGAILRDGTLNDVACNDRAMFFCERSFEDLHNPYPQMMDKQRTLGKPGAIIELPDY